MKIEELNDLLVFIEAVNKDSTTQWDQPIGVGKWSINQIVSHIWLWDMYSLNLMLPLIKHGVALRFIDQSAINSNADSFAKTFKHKVELIELLYDTRRKLITECKRIYEENVQFYVGKNEHNIETYVEKFITSNDKHHIKQVEDYISIGKIKQLN